MSHGFEKIRFQVKDKSDTELQSVGTRGFALRGVGRPRGLEDKAVSFNNDEAAARYYLGKVLACDSRPNVRGLAGEEQINSVPDARMISSRQQPLTRTRFVSFDQTKDSIPIFGSRLNVEMDENRELINVYGEAAQISGVSPMPSLSAQAALKRIAEFAGKDEQALLSIAQPPELRFYYEEKPGIWHLAYFFKKVPAAPKEFLESAGDSHRRRGGFGLSPRLKNPLLDYLIDAHDGTILYYYSSTPLLGVPAVPAKCGGVDESGVSYEFWGNRITTGFEMVDPMRFIKTYDHQFKDLEKDPLPAAPIQNPKNNFANMKAGVSAHANATRVYDFYRSVLMRDGIDDKGMDLVSVVNCTYAADQDPPEWFNAVWYDSRMFYGQEKDAHGKLRSFSRFLDVIAHELTHGVTEYTSSLVYKDQSGALNESFSDVFGVIINNWFNVDPESVAKWNWEIGPGLGQGGLPLRDMSNPKKTSDPDHMKDYKFTSSDFGGVHTNSNIPNKAAYNMLTAKDQQGHYVFKPREVAVLYYLCLTRLNCLATFSDALETLLSVAAVYYAGDAAESQAKMEHIKEAFRLVGIE